MGARALCGGELLGDRLVRVVYLDEAGTGGKAQEPYIVVAGVIVHGDHQLQKLRASLAEIMEKHIPEADRESLVIHAKDLYAGNGYFDKDRKPQWDVKARVAVMDDLAALPKRLNLWVCWSMVKAAEIPIEQLRADEGNRSFNTLAVAAAYVSCLVDVNRWFKKNAKREHCFVVVEDNQEAKSFIKEVHKRHQNAKLMAQIGDDEELFPLSHVQEDPNFQEKRVAHPLVLADFVAFVIKRRLMKDQKINRFFAPLGERLSRLAS